jgi:O-antigen/teichoic acid export membrane protein
MATESMWSLGLELAGLLVMLLSFTLLGRTLGPEGYGGYASLYAIIGPLVTLACSGVVLALLEHSIRDREPLGDTARSCVSLTLAIGSVLVVVGTLLATHIVHGLSDGAIVSLLAVEFLSLPLVLIAAATVQAGEGFIGAAKIRLVIAAGRATVLVGLFATDELTVANLGLAQLTFTAVLAVIVMRMVGRKFGFPFLPGRIAGRHLKTNVVYSAAISSFALQNNGDQTVLAANRFTVDTGLYAAAYRVISLGLIPVGSMVEITHKRFLEQGEEQSRHLRMAMRLALIAGVYAIAFGSALVAVAPLLPVIMGDAFEGSVEIVRWGAPLVLFQAITIFPLNGLMGLHRTGLRTIIIMINAAFTMGLYIVLIPHFSWKGALAGSMIGDSVLAAVSWTALVICQRRVDRAGGVTGEEPAEIEFEVPPAPVG